MGRPDAYAIAIAITGQASPLSLKQLGAVTLPPGRPLSDAILHACSIRVLPERHARADEFQGESRPRLGDSRPDAIPSRRER